QANEAWTRGQIIRTSIIFVELLVLFAAIMLIPSHQSQLVTMPDVAPQPMAMTNMDTTPDATLTTVYVSSIYRVYVIQDGLHRLVARLDTCNNRYIEARFDGALTDLHDTSMNYRPNVVH